MGKTAVSILVIAVFFAVESVGYAQVGIGGVGNIGGVGGLGPPAPRRSIGGPRLTRNRSPVLSPALNLIPGAVDSFTGQLFLRAVPQEQFYSNVQRNDRYLQGLQREATADRNRLNSLTTEIQSGLSATGKRVQFMNTGGYFPR